MIKYFYILTPTLTFLGSPMLMDPPRINRRPTSYSKFGQVLPWENIDHGISSLLRVCLAPLQHFRSVVQENAAKEPEQGLEIDNYFYTSLASFPFIFLVSSMKHRNIYLSLPSFPFIFLVFSRKQNNFCIKIMWIISIYYREELKRSRKRRLR